jgi:ribose transport system ATP-binding protein
MTTDSQTRGGPEESQDSRPALLDARAFTKTFGAARVLDNVDVTVRAGEVRGLVGQNGSGKSTFIKLVAGVYALEAGSSLARIVHEMAAAPVVGAAELSA